MYFREVPLDKILFLDIETVPSFPSYQEMPDKWKKLWDKKAKLINHDQLSDEEFYNQAGIYSEFGKVIVISMGAIKNKKLIIKSIYGDNEKCILEQFASIVKKSFNGTDNYLCAHNGKEFDFPYLARRMIINGILLPNILDVHGKKPWEVKFLDTMELWKFGDYKHFTSLELLAELFGLPNPKSDIKGQDIWKIYWQDRDIENITEYCEKDVITLVQIFLKFRNEPFINQENIEIFPRHKC